MEKKQEFRPVANSSLSEEFGEITDQRELSSHDLFSIEIDPVLEKKGFQITVNEQLLTQYLYDCFDIYKIDSNSLSTIRIKFATLPDGLSQILQKGNKSAGDANIEKGEINIYVESLSEFLPEHWSLLATITLIHEIDHVLQPYFDEGKRNIESQKKFKRATLAKHVAFLTVWSAVIAGLKIRISRSQEKKIAEQSKSHDFVKMTRRVFLGRAVNLGLSSLLVAGGIGAIINNFREKYRYYFIDPVEKSAITKGDDFFKAHNSSEAELLVRVTLPESKND